MLKVGAIGGVFALRFALMRKNKPVEDGAQPEPAEVARPSGRPASGKAARRSAAGSSRTPPCRAPPFWLDAPYEPRALSTATSRRRSA